MVEHDRDLVAVKDMRKARVFKFGDGHRRRDVVAEHKVELCLDKVARMHLWQPGVRRQDLLGHCHPHSFAPNGENYFITALCHIAAEK